MEAGASLVQSEFSLPNAPGMKEVHTDQEDEVWEIKKPPRLPGSRLSGFIIKWSRYLSYSASRVGIH